MNFMKKLGIVGGVLMGRTVNVAEAGLQFCESLALGKSSEAVNHAMEAIKAHIQKLDRLMTIPLQQPARDLLAEKLARGALGQKFDTARKAIRGGMKEAYLETRGITSKREKAPPVKGMSTPKP